MTGTTRTAAGVTRELSARLRAWFKTDAAPGWILAGLLVAAALLRLTNLNWDQFTHIHPDERFLTMVTAAMKLPTSLRQFFDSSQSPMNPYNIGYDFFVYGTLPLFIVRVVAEFLQKINDFAPVWTTGTGMAINLTGYDGVHLVGRFMSGLFDLGVVWVLYLIGRRLYSVRVGLLAAALYTFAVLPLQQSHFYTVDTFGTFFAALAFYFCVRVAQGADPDRRSGWGAYVALGLSLGAALASRINLAPMVGVALLAAGIRAWDELSRAQSAGDKRLAAAWTSNIVYATLFRLLLMVALAAITFRMLQPYSFGGNSLASFSLSEGFRNSMRTINLIIKGDADQPPMHQWANRTAFVFPWTNMVIWGMGVLLGVTVWAGWALAAFQIVRGLTVRPNPAAVKAHLLPVAWVGGMFVYHSMQFSYTMRYYLPIYPMLIMLGAWLLWWLVDQARAFQSSVGAGLVPAPTDEPSAATRIALRAKSVASRFWTAPVAYGLMTLVVVTTLLWGWGFLAIYRRPLTRITASKWIYANVPEGSVIGNEHWDDPLPFSIDGNLSFKPGGEYYGLRKADGSRDGLVENYAEDSPEKREQLIGWLNDADILVLSSNRLWGSIPRLPMRFPMTKEYYDLLFDGKLGFELAGRFTSFPTIFGIPIDDTGAEEAFSVYDHPEVRIYRKTPAYSESLVRSYFDQIDVENTIQMWPKQVTEAPTALLLTAKEYVTQQLGGTWSSLFDLDALVNRSPVVSALVWLVLVILLGLAAFPITFVVLRRLPDRGYGVSKTLGLLLLAWLAWFAPALKLTAYTRPWIALCLGLMFGFAAALGWRRRGAIRAFVAERKGLLLTEEAVFLILFLLFLLIRIGNPDLWHPARGGEKPMEFAFLNAVIRSTVFPPYDPWHAGGYMNYYYFGWVIVGTLVKLTGIVPWVAYNLAVPTLFALTGVGAFSVAFALAEGDRGTQLPGDERPVSGMRAGSLLAGLAGLFFVTIIGNLGNAKLLIDQLSQRASGSLPSGVGLPKLVLAAGGLVNVLNDQARLDFPNDWWFWNASRVIPDTINEFPFFTFTYADLHAHMIALPLTLLALAAVVALAQHLPRRSETAAVVEPSPWRISLPELAVIVLLGFVVGALRATNTWDFPTYALAGLVGLVVLEITRRGPVLAAAPPDGIQEWLAFGLRAVVSVVWRFVVLFAVGAVAFYPFTSKYATAYAGLEQYKDAKTLIPDYLTHWGFFIALAVAYLAAEFVSQRRERRLPAWLNDALPFIVVAGFLFIAAGWILGVQVWLVALPLAFLAVILAFGRDLPPARRTALLLLALALAITMGVEVLRQKDDIGRMNTVFKFYLQAWTLFGVSLAYGLARFAHIAGERRSNYAKLAWAVVGVLFVGAMLYPPFAARAKIRDRFSAEASPRGLDGMAYMDKAQYFDNGQDLALADDKAAMLWLMQNVQGSPTILEAQIPEYRWGSRFSVYTGLPTVQGWGWHERQQRSVVPNTEVERRASQVAEIYNTLDLSRAKTLLDRYGVRYVIVGQEERAYYAPEGLAKFPELEREGYLRQVYQGGAVTIYEIVAKDRGRVESYAYFLKPLFGEPSDLESMTFVSPGPANSPARQ